MEPHQMTNVDWQRSDPATGWSSDKCLYCGKPKGYHKAVTFNCPGGRKHRVHGYPWFYATQLFKAKPARGAK
jgi:hypothetical protein